MIAHSTPACPRWPASSRTGCASTARACAPRAGAAPTARRWSALVPTACCAPGTGCATSNPNPNPNPGLNPNLGLNPNPSPGLNPTLTLTRTRTLSRHGLCDAATGLCACKEGWAGDNCAQRACAKHPHGCLNGGTCRGETCFCPFGFTGEDCGQRLCPRGCSGRGVCGQDGACTCPSGWAGVDCAEPSCPRGTDGALCSNKGGCLLDPNAEHGEHQVYTCLCEEDATGEACEKARCPDRHNP